MKRLLDAAPMFAGWLSLTLLAVFPTISSIAADDGAIAIELNKIEQTEEGCRPLFLFDNRSGHQLNVFQVELALFDVKGVFSQQVLLDMAPLYKDKKVVASFLMSDLSCDEIGSILVNGLPSCINSGGADLDCLGLLDVTSRSSIPLEK